MKYPAILGLLVLCLSLFVSGCGVSVDKEQRQNQIILDEADLYLEFGQRNEALARAHQAIRNLNLLLAESPSESSYLLLHARALLTAFLAKNAPIIQKSPLQPKSLIHMPKKADYIDYDRYVGVALLNLRKAEDIGAPLESEQKAALHAMLASIYRLQMKTMSEANIQYKMAIQAYKNYLYSLEIDQKPLGKKSFAIQQVTNQIRHLILARSEVKIAQHKWQMALDLLQAMMGGDDLAYFDVKFQQLEEKIAELQELANREHPRTPDRANAIAKLVAEKREFDSKAKELASASSYKVNLLQTEIELAALKNNLMYRIICYYWLNDMSRYEQARVYLRKYYPSLDAQLSTLLKQS